LSWACKPESPGNIENAAFTAAADGNGRAIQLGGIVGGVTMARRGEQPMTRKETVAIYCRVSTQTQDPAAQQTELKSYAELRGWKIFRTYTDVVSGSTTSRLALNQLMADARNGKFDRVLTWRFDRFGRSLRHLISALEEFKRLKIHFISATEGVDTSTPGGELAFQIFGAMAQFERGVIRERVMCGLAQAVKEGRVLGRPPLKRLTAEEIDRVRADRTTGAFT
jgi:DNA invertase Pin-like site-specific DNA recombinase